MHERSLKARLLFGVLAFILLIGVGRAAISSQDFDELARKAARQRTSGQLDEAVGLYRKLVDSRPNWQEGWWRLGTSLYDLGRYDEALRVFQDMVSRWPYHGPAIGLIGLCQFQLREYERALQNFQKGHVLGFGDNPALVSTIRYHAAIVLNRLERFEAAYAALKTFALEGTRSRGIVEAFGLSVLRMAYLPEETPSQKKAVVTAAGRAAWEAEHGNREAADELYRQLIADFPDQPNVHYAYGRYLLALDPGPALEQFKQELEREPDNATVLLQIALEYIQEGRFEEARPYAERAVSADPGQYAAHSAVGQILLELGKTDEAIRELERSLELEPLSPESHYLLAQAYLKVGRKEEALQQNAEFKRLYEMRRQADQEILGSRVEAPSSAPRH